MRKQAVALALGLYVMPAAAVAQSGQSDAPRAAEEFIEIARQLYSVVEDKSEPCPTSTGSEIVVCRERVDPESQSLPSPTERAYAAGEMPPDRIPQAPYVLGLPECGVEVVCHSFGRAPPPIYIIDLSAIPQPLTPEEAALVFRAESLPPDAANPAAASPAAAP